MPRSTLLDIGKILGRAGLIRSKCGFFDAEPPYHTHVIQEACFPDVSVTPQRLPRQVIEMVVVDRGTRRLFYNERVSNEVRRVGIVHGLGPLLEDLKGVESGSRNCDAGAGFLEAVGALPVHEVEAGCDLLAAEVLAPLAVVHRYAPDILEARTHDEELALRAHVHRLASRFQIPEDLMRMRLRDLALFRQSSYFIG